MPVKEVCRKCGSDHIATEMTEHMYHGHKMMRKRKLCMNCHSYGVTKITNKRRKK